MKVSVCIPTFNQASYVEQSIRSVLNQEQPPDEIIVSNDCSTDNTKEILDRLATEIDNLKIIHQQRNLGITANTNHLLELATGDYIVRLDSDDLLLPGYISKLSALLSGHPSAGYAHAAVNEIDENGSSLKYRKLFRKTGYQEADTALRAAQKGYRVAANIIMFRKTVLQNVGYIQSKENFAEDFYLSAQIAASGYGNVYSEDVLCCYRVWNDSGFVRQKRKLAEISGIDAVFREVLEPAFKARHWNLQSLRTAAAAFAMTHAQCLSWKIYSAPEKAAIKGELMKLSSSPLVKRVIWFYENGLGSTIETFLSFKSLPKRVVKKLLLR